MSLRYTKFRLNLQSVLSIAMIIIAIMCPHSTRAQFPNPLDFNTATNSTNTGTLSVGSNDLHWQAAMTSSLGTYVPAIVCGNAAPVPGGWANSPFANCNWISYPYNCGLPAVQTCSQPIAGVDIFYKTTFVLPPSSCGQAVTTPSAYCLSLDFYADNCVYAIYVNNIQTYLTPFANPYFYTGFLAGGQITASLCNNWQIGLNTIIVHVKSGYSALPVTYEGFLAQANQTVNALVGAPLIVTSTQTNAVCFGGSGAASVTASGTGGPYTYTWFPSGGNTNLATSLAAGTYSCIVTSSNLCTFTKTLTITQPGATTLNIAASSYTACAGSNITLIASVAGGNSVYSYSWSGGGVGNTNIVSQNSPGAYTYSAVSQDALNCLLSNTISIDFLSTLTLSVTNPAICPGSTTTLIANGASGYTWYPSGIIGPSLTANPAITTVYTVTGFGANACTTTTTSTITIPPTLSLTIGVNSPSACVGSIITLTASNSGGTPGYTYAWTGGPSTASYSVSQAMGSYVYTVASADVNNCSATQTVTIDFIDNPVITVPDVSICPGSSGTLNASGANTYTWYPSSTNGVSFTASPLTTTVYSVIGTAVSGCTANATASIMVKPTPSLSFQTATITCANLGSATVTPSGGIGPFSYTWMPTAQNSSIATGLYPGTYTLSVFDGSTTCTSTSFTNFVSLIPFTGTVSSTNSITCNGIPTGTASIDLSGGSGAQTYSWTSPASISQISATVNALSAGIHTISVTDGITFCNVTHTFLITQPTAQTLNVNASPNLSCVGSSVSLNANNSGGTPGYTYIWIAGPSTTSHTVTEVAGGTYIYTVQSQDSYNCPSTNTVAVTFVDYPVMSAPGTSICLGSNTILTANGASSYTWYPGNFSGSNFSISPTANTSYTLIGTISGCNDTLITNVVVYTLPIAIISGTNTFCEGQTLNLTGSGGTSYLWNGPSDVTSSSPNLTVNDVTLNYSGIYSLLVTSAEGCTATTSQSLTIIPRPVITVSGTNVCIGMTTTLSASGGVSYFWNGPTGYTSTSSIAVIPVVNNASTGIYTVVITGSNSCVSSGSVEIIGFPYALPVPTIYTDSTVCVNSAIILQGNGGISYFWNGPGGFTSPLATPTLIAGGIGMSGIYTLSVKNSSNCAASTTVSITVYPLPTATLVSSKNNGCVPFCSDFYLYAPGPAYPIVSTDFLVKGLTVANSSFNYCFLNAEDCPVKVIIRDINGCVNTSSLLVSGWPLPKAEFSYLPAIPVENEDIIRFTDISSGASINAWSWYFTSNNGDSSHVRNPEYMYKKGGTFPVALVVKNKWGCSDTLVKTIKVNDNFSFYVPNSFTPNGDGINDIFQPKGVGVMKYTIEIFDRWGEKIFNSSIFETGWDGTYKGEPCKSDVYIWKIELINPSGKNLNYSGHVSLLEN